MTGGEGINKQIRVNEKIRVREVRLIDVDSKQLGVVSISEALKIAADRDLDLVEVAPNADPPVCKVMDFGKYKYQMSKKQPAKKTMDVKMMKVRPRIDEHDLIRKIRSIKKFIEEGNKVKIVMFFRGRERGRPDLGMKVFDRLKEILSADTPYNVLQEPKQEGANITMVISPK